MITIACAFWDANRLSKQFSRHYTEADVCALYRGFKRNLSVPFRFICWSEKERDYAERGIEQRQLVAATPSYGCLTQCYELNEPTIMVGLDTVIVGNCDQIAAYCLGASKPAVPIDPFKPETVCNGVTLVPGGNDWLWREYEGQNDMDWIRDNWKAGRIDTFDALFPNQIVSYKASIREHGLSEETRIVYFHGEHKMHELPHVGWIAKHWEAQVGVNNPEPAYFWDPTTNGWRKAVVGEAGEYVWNDSTNAWQFGTIGAEYVYNHTTGAWDFGPGGMYVRNTTTNAWDKNTTRGGGPYYWVEGTGWVVNTGVGATGSDLLLETGDHLLLESGDAILMES